MPTKKRKKRKKKSSRHAQAGFSIEEIPGPDADASDAPPPNAKRKLDTAAAAVAAAVGFGCSIDRSNAMAAARAASGRETPKGTPKPGAKSPKAKDKTTSHKGKSVKSKVKGKPATDDSTMDDLLRSSDSSSSDSDSEAKSSSSELSSTADLDHIWVQKLLKKVFTDPSEQELAMSHDELSQLALDRAKAVIDWSTGTIQFAELFSLQNSLHIAWALSQHWTSRHT